MRFIDFIFGYRIKGRSATDEEITEYERLAVNYLRDDTRNRVLDLFNFVRWESEKGVVPCTARVHIVGVQQWFIENDIPFTDKDKTRLRRIAPRGGRRTNIKYMDITALREIIAVSDPRMRAFILVAACTGMRISEMLSLSWSRVSFPDRQKLAESEKLTEIYIADSKNQSARRVWITREAEDALLVWKNETPAYLRAALKCSANLGITNTKAASDRVFPFSTHAVYPAWNDALKRVGRYSKDEVTQRGQLNVHRLRGFFKMQAMPIVGSEMSELMMGHCDAYGNAYNGLPDNQLEKLFQKCEGALTVAPAYGASREIASQAEEMRRVKAELEELRGVFACLNRDGGLKSLPSSVCMTL
jgi:integrase